MSHPRRIIAHLLVCGHKSCRKEGGGAVIKELKHAVRDNDLRGRVMLSETDCLDQCKRAPVVVVYPEGVWYEAVDKKWARAIVEQHIVEGRAIESHVLYRPCENGDAFTSN